jgi:hypothetical protein
MIDRALVYLLFAVALAGCGRDGSAATLDEPIQLAPGEAALFAAEKLEVTFVRVSSDSRCPTDVSCFWAGEILVRLAVRGNGIQAERDLKEFQKIALDGYIVDLLEVLPARGPQSQRIAASDYRVTLKVTRSNSQ